MKKKYISYTIFNILMITLALIFFSIKKTDLVIYIGVNFANAVTIGFWILIAFIFIVGNFTMIRKILKEKRAVQTVDVLVAKVSSKDIIAPEEIRSELENYKKLYPNLSNYIDSIYGQLDSIDRKQEKLHQIFEKNHIASLDAVESAINQAEQAICRNVVKILNRVILWDPLEVNKSGKEQIYIQHRAYITKYIDINEGILSKCDILLSETVDYVNEKDSDDEGSQFHLDVMTETVQALKAMNHIEI